jgi:hypothetical protein
MKFAVVNGKTHFGGNAYLKILYMPTTLNADGQRSDKPF